MSTNRRDFLTHGGIAAAALAGATSLAGRVSPAHAQPNEAVASPRSYEFAYALNTGTIRGQKLGLAAEIETAAKAGYQAIEPWLDGIHKFAEAGGSLQDVRKRCADLGLQVCSGIGFAAWIVNDDEQRRAGLEQMKRDMDALAQIGGTHIAASPAGAHRPGSPIELDDAAQRYAVVCELGRTLGIIPQLEIWGSSANLSHGSQALYVAAQSGHPDACVLLDAYHMYKGGTPPAVLKLLGRQATHCFHMNDYPADPPRETIADGDRVWPGDGIAPLTKILRHLAANHCRVALSVELFNRDYWQLPAEEAARTGLEKMRSAVAAAGLE
ncbi:MAG: sugar phosphate isomerase/epimerase [Candidatus Anammoximicrobium sp.]|nr:sugar phosphate isomerase/epimerase [Candidatus Anammoximicrobium sp.]